MKEKIIEIISKHTPETKYIDGANATDEILSLLENQKVELLEALNELIDPLTGMVGDYIAHEIGKERAYKIELAIEKATS